MVDAPIKSKVLIVDDTPENIQVLMGTLKDQYAIVAAINGEKALKLAVSDPQPNVILLDIMMPKLDGYTACDTLRKVHPNLPIVMLSAKDRSDDVKEAWDWGADHYLTKPFDRQDLEEAIHKLLNRANAA